MIDPPEPLFMMPIFTEFLKFAKDKWDSGKKLLIHCNRGESRAPSLALLFLAKCLKKLAEIPTIKLDRRSLGFILNICQEQGFKLI